MYNFNNYASMIRDEVRVRAYRQALDRHIDANSVVLDLGSGTGAFALYAARKGAKLVYAVETNPLLRLARKQAEAMGLSERIIFFEGPSEQFEPAEKATLLIADLRGALPFLGNGRKSVEDARLRLLTKDAVLLPEQDRIFAAPVSHPSWYDRYVSAPWQDNALDMTMPVMRQYQASLPVAASGVPLSCALPGQLVGVIDYRVPPVDFAPARLDWRVTEPVVIHAVVLWFESSLGSGITISGAPDGAAPEVYGRMLFPLLQPLAVEAGDRLSVRIGVWPVAGDFAYTWRTQVTCRNGQVRQEFQQHSVRELFGDFA